MNNQKILRALALGAFGLMLARNASAADCESLFAHHASAGVLATYADVELGSGVSDLFFNANHQTSTPLSFDPEMTGEKFPGQFTLHFKDDLMLLLYAEADRPPLKLLAFEKGDLKFGPRDNITAKAAVGGVEYTLYLGKQSLTLMRLNASRRTGAEVVLAK